MANVKITELTAATALASTDVLPIVDVGADATKKVSVSDLLRNLPDGTASAPALAFADDQNTGVLSPNANELAFATSGTQRLVIDSSGNVGIGTTSPGTKLDVNGAAKANYAIASGGLAAYASSTGGLYSYFASTAGHINAVTNNSGAAGTLIFATGSERMRIDSSGSVGIGTTSPAAKLHVENGDVRLEKDTKVTIGFRGHTSGSTALAFRDANAAVDRMTIDSSGNVGIGNTSPASGLDIRPGVTGALNAITMGYGRSANPTDAIHKIRWASDDLVIEADSANTIASNIQFRNDGTEYMRIDSSGNVGIGTSSADFKLDVNGSIGVTEGQVVAWHDGGGNLAARIYGSSTDELRFEVGSSASRAMTIDSSGRLLIGTTSDTAPGAFNAKIQTASTSFDGSISLRRDSNNTGAQSLVFGKSRGSLNGNTIVQSSDTLGTIDFYGADGTDLNNQAAQILAAVDGTPGSNDMPGRLVFSTTADGANVPTERMRLNSAGNLGLGTTSPSSKLHVNGTAKFDNYIHFGGVISTPQTAAAIYRPADNQLAFSTANSERMRINNSGVVKLTQSGNNPRYGSLEASGDAFKLKAFSGNASHSATMQFFTGANSPTERMRIDSSGRLYVGTTNSLTQAAHLIVAAPGVATAEFYNAGGCYNTWSSGGTATARGFVGVSNQLVSGGSGSNFCVRAQNNLNFAAGGNLTRLTIDNNGTITNKSSNVGSVVGEGFTLGREADGYFIVTRDNENPVFINRTTSDGTLIKFYAQSNLEGAITVSGNSVTLSGGHLSRWSQLPGGAERTEILRGSVLSNLDEMCEWGEEDNEQLNRMKISDVEGDVNVSGVFMAWDDDDDTYTNDFYCAMTGDFVIRIAQGTTVARGDLLMSAGDGTAKPQDDDIVRSKTIAKVTSTTVSTTYADGSYCVPCVLMAC